MKKYAWIALAALLAAAPAYALELGVQASYWYPVISADVAVGTASSSGDTFSIEDDMGVGNEGFLGARAFFGLGAHHFSLAYTHVKYEGDGVQTKKIQFGGITIQPDDYVDFTLDYDMIDAQYRWDLLDLENVLAGFSLGPILGAKFLEGSVETSVTRFVPTPTTLTEKEDFSAVVPYVGAGLHVGILADILEARAALTGMKVSGDSFFDGFAELSVTPFPFVNIDVGYRAILLDAEYDDVAIDLSQSGVYGGVTVAF